MRGGISFVECSLETPGADARGNQPPSAAEPCCRHPHDVAEGQGE